LTLSVNWPSNYIDFFLSFYNWDSKDY